MRATGAKLGSKDRARKLALAISLLASWLVSPAQAANWDAIGSVPPSVVIPRLERAPSLEDFDGMKPSGEVGGRMAKVEGFVQREPSDGAAATQPTEVYLGYDDSHLYVVFLAFDADPGKVRARMVRREDIFGDDTVEMILDTFADQRRGYAFLTNPFGIQWDALWTEGQGFDQSFDTIWDSDGRLTEQGYMVRMAIPFKSLRFPSTGQQTWKLLFLRSVPRMNEFTTWPHMSSRIEGRLNQAATATGMENISPGRNFQLIPYGVFRSFRALDTRDEDRPQFEREKGELDGGLDAKLVFKDSLVLDLTVNPDFSQVESDQPQVTVNQRFEVFFPEKRPFFLENANFFETPINLVFTRRIADPQFGARLTGKAGPYALGALLIDDQSPGRIVPDSDPLTDKRALFGIFRVSRDLFQQSSLGFIYADREFEDEYNRVGGVDGRFKLGQNWTASFQGVTSWTRTLEDDGTLTRSAGPGYSARLAREGRQFFTETNYLDYSPGFQADTGFVPRTDIREVWNFSNYRFRPEGKLLISWGPNLFYRRNWDHSGTRLDWLSEWGFEANLVGESWVGFFTQNLRERLRPDDFDALTANRDFGGYRRGFFFGSGYLRHLSANGSYSVGEQINFAPPEGEEPFLAEATRARLELTVRPMTPLRIDNTYFLTQFTYPKTGASIFNNHILRSKWNWQFNRELSLRAIVQYDSTLANPALTELETSKNINADFLLTYLINPWTALYVGYNGNAQNLLLCEGPRPAQGYCRDLGPEMSETVRPRRQFINDAKQFFVKFSYLIRF